MTQTERITFLLHHSRSTTFNKNSSLELYQSMKGASPQILAVALLQFSVDLMEASRSCMKLSRDFSTAQPQPDITNNGIIH